MYFPGAGTGIVTLTLGALRSALDHEDSGAIIATDLRACQFFFHTITSIYTCPPKLFA